HFVLWCLRSDSLVREPSLEHQHVPESRRLVAPSREVLSPEPPHRLGIEVAFVPEPTVRDQVFRPIAQRPAQPLPDWDGETRFRALDELSWDVAVEDLT